MPTELTRYRTYLRDHFLNGGQQPANEEEFPASVVDCDRYMILILCFLCRFSFLFRLCVRVVLSSRAGMGKTLYITQMAEKLQSKVEGYNVLITIPIHGPVVTTDSVMEYLVKHSGTSHCAILHFDISPSVINCVAIIPLHQ